MTPIVRLAFWAGIAAFFTIALLALWGGWPMLWVGLALGFGVLFGISAPFVLTGSWRPTPPPPTRRPVRRRRR